jgi:hypothetical protein
MDVEVRHTVESQADAEDERLVTSADANASRSPVLVATPETGLSDDPLLEVARSDGDSVKLSHPRAVSGHSHGQGGGGDPFIQAEMAGLVLGLMGVFTLLTLWPLFFIFHYSGLEPFEWPPPEKGRLLALSVALDAIYNLLLLFGIQVSRCMSVGSTYQNSCCRYQAHLLCRSAQCSSYLAQC